MKINFDVQWLKAVKVKNNPYLPTSLTQNQEIRFTKTFQSINARYDNLFPVLDFTKDILFRFELFLRKRIQKLCLGKFKRPPRLEKSLKFEQMLNVKCISQHHLSCFSITVGPCGLHCVTKGDIV